MAIKTLKTQRVVREILSEISMKNSAGCCKILTVSPLKDNEGTYYRKSCQKTRRKDYMDNVLVTGADGFFGSHLTEELV